MARTATHRNHRSHRHGLRRLALRVSSDWLIALIAHAVATLALTVAAELLHLPTCGR